jgi:hypothetical protein
MLAHDRRVLDIPLEERPDLVARASTLVPLLIKASAMLGLNCIPIIKTSVFISPA